METQTAFIGSDRTAHLHAEPAIDLDLAFVILPWNTERDHALRLNHSLQDLLLTELRVLLQHRHNRLKNLRYGILELRLIRIPLYQEIQSVLSILFHVCQDNRPFNNCHVSLT